MDKHGRLTDVIIEDVYREDTKTSEEWVEAIIYADTGYKQIISNVIGVIDVYYYWGTYKVHFDKRYDHEFVKREIEAAIKCNSSEE